MFMFIDRLVQIVEPTPRKGNYSGGLPLFSQIGKPDTDCDRAPGFHAFNTRP
jgi:hypothetical protein